MPNRPRADRIEGFDASSRVAAHNSRYFLAVVVLPALGLLALLLALFPFTAARWRGARGTDV